MTVRLLGSPGCGSDVRSNPRRDASDSRMDKQSGHIPTMAPPLFVQSFLQQLHLGTALADFAVHERPRCVESHLLDDALLQHLDAVDAAA